MIDCNVPRFKSLLCNGSVTRRPLVCGCFRMHHEARAFEYAQYVLGTERRKPSAHAVSGTRTPISSFTGALSEGMGR